MKENPAITQIKIMKELELSRNQQADTLKFGNASYVPDMMSGHLPA